MDSEGTWTRVPDVEYPVPPILCTPVSKPLRLHTAEEEALAQAYPYPIVEEDIDSNDEA